MLLGLGALRHAVRQAGGTLVDRSRARAWFLPLAVLYVCTVAFASAVLIGFGGTVKYAGWNWSTAGGETVVTSVDPGGPAATALAVGDRLLAVNGDGRASVRGPRPWLQKVDPDERYAVTAERAGVKRTVVLTMRATASPRDVGAGLTDLLLSLVFATVSLFVWWAKPEDGLVRWCSSAGLLMAFFLASSAIGPVSPLLGTVAFIAYFLLKSIFPLHLVAGAEFFARFPTGKKPQGFWRSGLNLLWVGAAAVWLLTLPQRLLPQLGLEERLDVLTGLDLYARPELGQVLLRHGFAGVCALYLFAVSIRNYRELQDAAMRLRVRWVLLGSTVGVVPSLIASASLALLDGSGLVPARTVRQGVGLYSFATLSLGWIPVAVGYAVVCHRLLSIRLAITGGLQQLAARRVLQLATLLVPVIAGCYLIMIWRRPDVSSPFATVLCWLLLIFGIVRKEVLDLTDRWLHRLPYNREQATRGLMEQLRHEPTRAGVAARAKSVVEPLIRPSPMLIYAAEGCDPGRFRRLYSSTFGEAPMELSTDSALAGAVARSGALLLGKEFVQGLSASDRLWLERENIELAVPIASAGDRCRGVLLLGSKSSGDRYTATDIDILRDVARCVALALEVLDLEEARRLSEAKRIEAEEADRRKLQFLAHMSHELRTPLHGMLGVTDLLLGTELSDQQQEYARLILRSSESMVAIANDILDLSKLEAGKVQLHTLQINWGELIEDCLAIAAERARSEKVEFLWTASATMPVSSQGDPHRVRQILTNLLDNAAKYTERGWVIVRGSTIDRELHIEVEDTGRGIPEELQARLFSAYEQDLTLPAGDRSSGAGLGLAISKRLAEAMGGRLTYKTQLGIGTTFALQLPLLEAVAQPSRALPLLGIEVALVDERRQSSEAYTMALQRLGARVRVAQAPVSTRHDLADCQVAIVIHREESGRLLGKLRTVQSATPAPILLVHGSQMPLSAAEARAHSVVAHLRRPVREATLARAVLEALQRFSPPASAVQPSNDDEVRVLVVEDDPASARMMELLLRQIGCSTTVAPNGESAVRLIQTVPFSLVFLDYDLPGLSGPEIIQRVRALPQGASRTPMIVLSGHAELEKMVECTAAGADDYLVKPLGVAGLQEAVQRHVHRVAPR